MTEKKKRKPGGGRKKSPRELKVATFRIYADQLPLTSAQVREAVDKFLNQSKNSNNG